MSDPVIVRLARALCVACGGRPDRPLFCWGRAGLGPPEWTHYRQIARATLETLREPDEAQIAAGVGDAWTAAIDAALAVECAGDA